MNHLNSVIYEGVLLTSSADDSMFRAVVRSTWEGREDVDITVVAKGGLGSSCAFALEDGCLVRVIGYLGVENGAVVLIAEYVERKGKRAIVVTPKNIQEVKEC